MGGAEAGGLAAAGGRAAAFVEGGHDQSAVPVGRLFLLTGIAWLILSWVALRFTPASVPTVGALLGVLFLVAMINEFFIASVRSGWRWLHIVMGIIFAFGAGWSFAQPDNAFWTLASILGLLLIFRGTLDIITSASTREVNSTWWLGMVAGILEALLGF